MYNSSYEKKTEEPEMPQATKSYYLLKRCGYVVTAGMGSGGIGSGSPSGWKPKKEDDERFLGKLNSIKRTHFNGKKGGYDRDTKIGKDGRAIKERHYTNHNTPAKHSNPHDHEIHWDEITVSPIPGSPIDYINGVPEFKSFKEDVFMNEDLRQEESFEDINFKTVSEFKFAVSHGSEIQFEWNNKDYAITHPDGIIYVCEAYTEKNAKQYKTADEALEHMIDGQKLREIITKVEVWDRTI